MHDLVDMLGGAFIAAAALLPLLFRVAFPYHHAPPRTRKLLVVDTAASLRSIRERGLIHYVTCRDLDGYFDEVVAVHPLVGAAGDEPPESAFGPPSLDKVAPRHAVMESRVGRFHRLAGYPRMNFILAQVALLRAIRRQTRHSPISVIRVGDPYYPGLLGLLLARMNRVPLVVRIGGNQDHIFATTGVRAYPRLLPSRAVEKRIERFVLPRADLVAGANKDNLDAAIRNGARPGRTTLFRYGTVIDPVHFTEPSARETQRVRDETGLGERRLLLYVGRLEPVKHSIDLVDVLARVRRDVPDAGLVLVGDGSERTTTMARAEALGVSDAVALVGSRSQQWIARAAACASVIVSPHMGRALVETALGGAPIVAYDLDWQGEFVETGMNGVLVPCGDIDAMSREVIRLLQDEPVRRRMGASARASALVTMDPRRLADHERAAYQWVLAGGVEAAPQP
jgi:glycosyltransferase involved in cell wall biosynthesis